MSVMTDVINSTLHILYQRRATLDEPVEAELWRLANGKTELVEYVLAVEAQLVEHTDEEAVLLLRVVLAFVGAICNPQLVERSLVAAHLNAYGRERILYRYT